MFINNKMRISINDASVSCQVVSPLQYKLIGETFIIETHKIGLSSDSVKVDILLDFNDHSDPTLLNESTYCARGICMHDGDPLVISFGGLIGKFDHIKEQIDKNEHSIVHLYLKVK